MNPYPEELKASLIARMLAPSNVNVAELARETGIPKDTLYTWRRNAHKGDAPAPGKPCDGLSSEQKFHVVLEAASLNEIELGEYCRHKGLFPQQISAWREVRRQAHAPLAPRRIAGSCATRPGKSKVWRPTCAARRRRWPKPPPCWCSKKKSAHSGRRQRTRDRPCRAQGSDRLDP